MVTKISIIIPIYNSSSYLTICLDSILTQSFKDFEVICVNDGSTDNSLDILNRYKAKDERIVIINQANQGQGIARNNAILKAKGDFIVFVDSDDSLAYPNSLELMFNSISSSNSDIVVFKYNKYYSNSKATKEYKLDKNIINKTIFSIEEKQALLRGKDISITPCNKIYKTNFLQKNNILFAEKLIYEDVLFFFKAILLAKKISFLDKVLYTYVRHPGSTMSIRSEKNQDMIKVYFLVKDFLIKYNLFDAFEDVLIKKSFFAINYQFRKTPLQYKRDFFMEMRKFTKQFNLNKFRLYFKFRYFKLLAIQKLNFWTYLILNRIL